MSSPERLPAAQPAIQPQAHAEQLLEQFTHLGRLTRAEHLPAALVEAAARLSGCRLAQLYLLDHTHTCLTLVAEWLDERLAEHEASLPSDYDGEQLLQYCLCQNRPLSLTRLDPSLHETSFLPATGTPWNSLLCLPLEDEHGRAAGLLLLASELPCELDGFSASLASLGAFALAQRQLLQRPLERQAISTEPSGPALPSGYGLIGSSPAMRTVYRLIGKVLHNSTSVLLTGETGTGKELVARAIHDYGSRRSQAFIVQNCAALPESLLESELFGYCKGAFSGAEHDRKGLFDAADGGTLFLDEIGDMQPALQAKLLRTLQEGEVRPLGSPATHKVNVRIIAATHHDLRAMVEAGQFREDLFYRLSHFPIELPPLRTRSGDILQLARHFASQAAALLRRDTCQWSEAALDHLAAYAFPGNVRELKGLVERAVLLCESGHLLPEHFGLRRDPGSPCESLTLQERLERVERNLLLDCLRKNQGNQSQAARELGLARRTLLYRMERLHISPGDI